MSSTSSDPVASPSADATVREQTPPPAPATLVSDDLHALLTRLELRFVHRSPRTMWIGRQMRVQFDLALAHLRIHMHDLTNSSSTSADTTRTNGRARLDRELLWDDVLGAHILTLDGEHVDTPSASVDASATYLFGVFACPAKHQRKGSTTLKKRQLLELFFQFRGDQMRDVDALRTWVNYLADPRSTSQREKAQSVVALTPDPSRGVRRFCVIINPVGGSGKGKQMFENKVAPLFKYANIDAQVEITTHAGHATELMKALPLNVYDCVLSVGGDGSLSEVTQGLMARPDWNRAIRQPIGIIPSGSGNGLSHSMLHQSRERAKPLNAAFALAKGRPQDIDIASIRNGKGAVMYSFLSLEWAGIADVDLLSEKLRMLGGLRFGVGFGHHIYFTKKEYSGTLVYLDDDDEHAQHAPPRYFDTHDPNAATYPPLDLIDCSRDDHATLGGTWKEVTGHFHLLWAMSITHASGDALVAPDAQLDDGYHYIFYIDGQAHARTELLSVLLAMDDGSHVKRASVQQIRTRAYKIVPDRPGDALCVDGELFEGPALECQVHRGLGRVIALPRASE